MSAAVATLVAFTVSCAVALLGTPLARRLALRTGFVDRPGSHKRHVTPVPYLGGLAIIAATFAGAAVGRRPGGHFAAIMIGGAFMGVVGLLDDNGGLKPLTRLLTQVAATVPVVASGIRMEVSGVAAFDVVFTVVWIVAITNAVNFLDNMDGLAAGLAAVAAAAACAVAAMSGQLAIAAMAAAVVGACVGFLAFNRPPAAIYMGDTGALFLGFILAALSLEVRPAATPPVSFLVPALLMALPFVDIVVVVLSRMRRAIPVATGGRNHLSHRLVARRLSPAMAVLVLVLVEAAAGTLAVCLDDRILSPVATAIAAAALLGSLVAFTARASVFDRKPTVRLLRRLGKIAAVVASATVLASALPVWAIVTSRGHIDAGIQLTTASLGDLHDGDAGSAAVDLARAKREFTTAERRLAGPLESIGLAVPVVNSNLRALRTMATVGSRLASGPDELVPGAAIAAPTDTAEFERAAPLLDRNTATLHSAATDVEHVNEPFLVPRVRRRLDAFSQQLRAASSTTSDEAELAGLAPAILGAEGTRSYVVASRTPSGVVSCQPFSVTDGQAVSVARPWQCAITNPGVASDRSASPDTENALATLGLDKSRVDGIISISSSPTAPDPASSPGLLGTPSSALNAVLGAFLSTDRSGAGAARLLRAAVGQGEVSVRFVRPAEDLLAVELGLSMPPVSDRPSPGSADPLVTISGGGCPAVAVATVSVDGVPAGLTTTNAAGTFAVPVRIPSTEHSSTASVACGGVVLDIVVRAVTTGHGTDWSPPVVAVVALLALAATLVTILRRRAATVAVGTFVPDDRGIGGDELRLRSPPVIDGSVAGDSNGHGTHRLPAWSSEGRAETDRLS
jgi:UDP-GlcNAc:undecaprenyl-phosphate GlcNAc-1-phosphate transferase